MNRPPQAFVVCGWSGSGMTTLLAELVRHFAARGLRIAVVKLLRVHGMTWLEHIVAKVRPFVEAEFPPAHPQHTASHTVPA